MNATEHVRQRRHEAARRAWLAEMAATTVLESGRIFTCRCGNQMEGPPCQGVGILLGMAKDAGWAILPNNQVRCPECR